jgi:protoheme ferro-lyase
MAKKGVLLVNLGTPDSPETKDVRKYLDEFLMDPRVIDVNPVLRTFLVKGLIVPFRSPKSAKLYKEIWDDKPDHHYFTTANYNTNYLPIVWAMSTRLSWPCAIKAQQLNQH